MHCERKGVLMRCQLPISNDLSEISGAGEFTRPAETDSGIFRSLCDLRKRPHAICLVNPVSSRVGFAPGLGDGPTVPHRKPMRYLLILIALLSPMARPIV